MSVCLFGTLSQPFLVESLELLPALELTSRWYVSWISCSLERTSMFEVRMAEFIDTMLFALQLARFFVRHPMKDLRLVASWLDGESWI
jgi:hypothetical protein